MVLVHMTNASPFDQLNSDKVVSVSAVEQYEAVRGGGFKLEEQVHGGVGLQGGQPQIAALGLEGHRVSNDGAHAKAGVELTEVDVSVLTEIYIQHTVEPGVSRAGNKYII